MNVASLLAEALAHHQAGRLAEAEPLYQRILQVQPRNHDCLHLLGVMQYQRGEHAAAVRQIDLALKINPKLAAAHNNRGNALKELKQFDEALKSFDRAIALDSRFADAFNNRGVVLYEQNRFKEALAAYERAIALKSDYAEAFNNRGNALNELQRFDEALASFNKAIELRPDFAEAFNNRGSALKKLKRFDEALASYDRAIALVPNYADAFNNRGLVLAELQRFDEALASHDRAIALEPHFAEALNGRGTVLYELKRFEEALASYDKAIAFKPDYAEAFNNRGNALKELQQFDAALASCDKAIALKPAYANAFNNRVIIYTELKRYDEVIADCDRAIALGLDDVDLFFYRGNALGTLKRFDEAMASYDKAIALKPDHAEAYNGRGIVLAGSERFDKALESYDQAITLKPDYVEAFNNRGIALKQLERLDEALASFDKAIAIKSDYAVSFNNRGNVLKELRQIDAALASYDRAIALKPDYAEAFNNRGNTLKELRRLNEALASYDQAIVLKADFAEAFSNRGLVLNDLRRLEEALASYDRAISLKPDFAEVFHNRGNVLNNLKRFDEVVTSCERAIALKPDQKYVGGLRLHAKMHICDWNSFDDDCLQVASKLENKILVAQPFTLLPLPIAPSLQLKCANLFIADRCSPAPPPLWRGERYAHRRIRVAYVSADLRDHAVAALTAGLFEHHDKSRFETIAISLSPDTKDRMRERLKSSFDRFFDAHTKSDREVAALMRDLEIDIAVDLNGFTGGARFNIFAFRAAPVQVNYLGYAGTLGQNYWDYIIADRFVIPEECHENFAEKVVYLPDSFMANDDNRKIAERTPTRAAAGLPEQGFVFCCFNNSYKFTPDVFDVWMRLLREVAGSVLWLPETNAGALQNLRAEAAKRGVPPERLIFAPRVPSNEEHLARLRLADLFLDTLYYNAHTTACDALWAGLPIITRPGQTFASRVAGSLLSAIGLPELITQSLDEYEALALKLARDPALLAAVKEKLARQRMSYPLFNTERFTRHMEAAYTTMWERSQWGEPPQSFAVTPIA